MKPPSHPDADLPEDAKHIANFLVASIGLMEAVEHRAERLEKDIRTEINTEADGNNLPGSIEAVKHALEMLMLRDREYAQNRGVEKGPVERLLAAADAKFDGGVNPVDAIAKETGIDAETWDSWLDSLPLDYTGDVPASQKELIDRITSECSLKYMKCMDQPDLAPHELAAATAIAQKLQNAFPVRVPLENCPILGRKKAVGTHTQMLLEGQRRFKDGLPTPANENFRTK